MLEDYAEKNGFTGIRHFTDNGISGTTFDQEGHTADYGRKRAEDREKGVYHFAGDEAVRIPRAGKQAALYKSIIAKRATTNHFQ